MGLAVGLSGLTAWFLYRFEALRSSLDLPPIGDPGYDAALRSAGEAVTASALGETFMFSAVVVGVALVVAIALRPRDRTGVTS
jgi:hypothetical protein